MLRRTRPYLPDHPYHIVQCGNNREACFVEPENYQYYLVLWKACLQRYGVGVHARLFQQAIWTNRHRVGRTAQIHAGTNGSLSSCL